MKLNMCFTVCFNILEECRKNVKSVQNLHISLPYKKEGATLTTYIDIYIGLGVCFETVSSVQN
jgi:hypothetical protein